LLAGSQAGAADLKPVYKAAPAAIWTWTGHYVGVHLGAGRGESRFDSVTDFIFPAFGVTVPALILVLTRSGTIPGVTASDTGLIGGAQAGFNWQTGNLVLGIEGDITAARLQGSTTFNASSPSPAGQTITGTYRTEIDWMASVRVRAGHAWDRVLVYVTGGAAFVHGQVNSSFTLANPAAGIFVPVPGSSGTTAASASFSKVGWTLGFGAEWALANNWSLAAEYRHSNFGSQRVALASTDPSGIVGLPALATNVRLTVDQVTARANWRFRAH
jgi:opacity protein-like surface antigen